MVSGQNARGQNARKHALTNCQKMKNRTKCHRTKCMITRTLTLILGHTLTVTGPLVSLYTDSLYLSFLYTLSPSL